MCELQKVEWNFNNEELIYNSKSKLLKIRIRNDRKVLTGILPKKIEAISAEVAEAEEEKKKAINLDCSVIGKSYKVVHVVLFVVIYCLMRV